MKFSNYALQSFATSSSKNQGSLPCSLHFHSPHSRKKEEEETAAAGSTSRQSLADSAGGGTGRRVRWSPLLFAVLVAALSSSGVTAQEQVGHPLPKLLVKQATKDIIHQGKEPDSSKDTKLSTKRFLRRRGVTADKVKEEEFVQKG